MKRQDREILNSIELSDLQENHRQIAEVVGMDGMIKLCAAFGGSGIYIPQQKELIKNKVYKNIYEEYNGGNIRELAVRYDVSESTIYNIVRDKISKGVSARIPGQSSLADLYLHQL